MEKQGMLDSTVTETGDKYKVSFLAKKEEYDF